MTTRFQSNFIAIAIFGSLLAVSGGLVINTDSTDPALERADARWSNPEWVGGTPTLTSGFKNWELCDLGGRIESTPPLFSMPHWGPAALMSASGCSTCGGTVTFNGDPKTAGLGLALAPPHDFSSDVGELPPSPHDHAFVMADSGEVVYTEVDFAIPGQGFDLVWSRTYRSAREFEGWMGYGWSFCAELYMVEVGSSGDVYPSLGDGRTGEYYEEDSGSYTSPDGYWDALTKGTRSSGHTPSVYANEPFFTKTEKNGVVWEFDRAIDGSTKDTFVCTKITDTWGNEFTIEYDSTEPMCLDTITDTEGREVTFTYHTDGNGNKDLITNVTVSDSSIHADYGNISIDYSYDYTKGTLSKVEKHKTRKSDGGTVVRPYTEYTYDTSLGYKDKNLLKVFYSEDSSTGDPSFEFKYNADAEDRCYEVVDADGEVHEYLHDQGDVVNGFYVKYTDPSDQRRDFVHEDYNGSDLTIAEVREYLEDEDGNDLSGHYDLTITRDCDCGQITGLEYPDGSEELWTYDSNGNVTKYTRTSASTESDLVKAWTYDTVANYSRMLTSSGWMRAEASPSAKVTYAWDSDGGLNTVTLPTVTTGVPSSQAIVYDYDIGTDGVLDEIDDPEGNTTAYSYSGDTLTITKGSGTSETMVSTETRDVMGNIEATTSHLDNAGDTEWTYTSTPDGRLLKAEGPNDQESEWEYNLRGQRTKAKQLLAGTTWTTTVYTVSLGGVITQTEADDGGIEAISTFVIEEGASNRYSESLNADDYGSREQWGYGSYGLPWKSFNVDDSGVSKVTTRTLTLERDTMGRVTKRVLMGGTEVDYLYDGFGRLTEIHEDIPGSDDRKTILTLAAWGAVEESAVKVGSTTFAKTVNYFDEANRIYKEEIEDNIGSIPNLVQENERDANARVGTRTDADGGETVTTWRADGRIKSITDAEGNVIEYAYNDSSKTMTVTHRDKDTSDASTTDYDVVTTYNAAGWITSVKDEGSASGNRTTSYTYDKAGRNLSVSSPLGNVTDFAYDNLGRMTSETVDVAGSTEAVTTYTYSDGGFQEKVTDANNIETNWTYDSFGRELTVAYTVDTTPNPDETSTTTKTYDTYGRLSTVTDEMGVVKTYNYDVAGQVDYIDINQASSGLGGPDRIDYGYDGMGRVTSGKTQEFNGSTYDDLTSVTRTYDGLGRMDSETQDGSRTLTFAYHESGAVEEITYPSGGPIVGVKYTIDDVGRVSKVERKLSTDVEGISTSAWEDTATFEYEGFREIERVQAEYDLERAQSWTTFRRPNALRYEKDSTNTLLIGYTNTWDSDGRIKVRERAHDSSGGYSWGEVYRYDKMGRLVQMWTNVRNPGNYGSSDPTSNYDDEIDWTLGKVNERESVAVTPEGGSATTTNYTSNDGYQYTQVGTPTLTWDDNGQLTDYGSDDYEWTALGQLEVASPDGISAMTYTYDAFGRRVSTSVTGGDTTDFIYHGWHMIGAYDDSNSEWLWQEIPMNAGEGMLEHIALDTNDIDGDTDTDEYRQYAVHEDWQNSVWALSDTSGAIVEEYVQDDPFGASHTLDSSSSNLGDFASEVFHLKRMHGGVVEETSGLYDFRYRWLAPERGGWFSRDPIWGANLHVAFNANPLTMVDYFGLQAQDPKSALEKALEEGRKAIPLIGKRLSRMNAIMNAQQSFAEALGSIYGVMAGMRMCMQDCCPDSSACDDLFEGDNVVPDLPRLGGPLNPGKNDPVKERRARHKSWKRANAAWQQGYAFTSFTLSGGYARDAVWGTAKEKCKEVVELCRKSRGCIKGQVVKWGDEGCPPKPNKIEPGEERKNYTGIFIGGHE